MPGRGTGHEGNYARPLPSLPPRNIAVAGVALDCISDMPDSGASVFLDAGDYGVDCWRICVEGEMSKHESVFDLEKRINITAAIKEAREKNVWLYYPFKDWWMSPEEMEWRIKKYGISDIDGASGNEWDARNPIYHLNELERKLKSAKFDVDEFKKRLKKPGLLKP